MNSWKILFERLLDSALPGELCRIYGMLGWCDYRKSGRRIIRQTPSFNTSAVSRKQATLHDLEELKVFVKSAGRISTLRSKKNLEEQKQILGTENPHLL
jgi:hypothetical protein